MYAELKACNLPLTHYYVYSGKVSQVPKAKWVIDYIESLKYQVDNANRLWYSYITRDFIPGSALERCLVIGSFESENQSLTKMKVTESDLFQIWCKKQIVLDLSMGSHDGRYL